MPIKHFFYAFHNTKKMSVFLIFMSIVLSGCATHKKTIVNISQPTPRVTDEDAFDDANEYLYEPPRIYRTWINSRATTDNQVVSAHFRYWVSSQGHWNVPVETEQGQGAELLSPS